MTKAKLSKYRSKLKEFDRNLKGAHQEFGEVLEQKE